MKLRLLFALVTAAFGLLVPMVVGGLTADYDARAQYISELGALGAPAAAAVNFGVFLPTSLLVLVTVVWLARTLRRDLRLPVLLLLGVAVGNLGAVLFPCDAGCPVEGTPRQGLHNLIGLLQYLSGGIALVWLGRRAARGGFVVGGLVVLASLFLMGGPGEAWRGFWQRVGELMLYGSLPLLARWDQTASD